jgi:hypothetical protein
VFFINDKEIDMNLSRLFKWNKEEVMAPKVSDELKLIKKEDSSNVIPLPVNLISEEQTLDEYLAKPKQSTTKGLMNAPEITEFFSENYFGLGRHNGVNYRTQDALELGKKSIISKFQNTLNDLLENKHSKINKLKNQLVAIEGISLAMTQQLEIACEHIQREIQVLTTQIENANTHKGWVLEALNRYQLGFIKGLNDAIEFELLAG